MNNLLYAPDTIEPLSWGARLLIMIGVARGLTCLHSAKLMYRGVKSGDILLDEDFNAKLGNFGLVKYGPKTGETHVSTMVMGSYGYAAQEYVMTGQLTMKSDIYGLGVVLMESITGRKAIDRNLPMWQQNLVELATQMESKKRKLDEIIDPRLKHNYPIQGASECFALALRCVSIKPKDRPSCEEVLQSLEHIYALHK
ncbi:putative protein kinase RLK-Pelle-RLCK-VIIa-2 family [Helianthus debilis subsp. tardiflorus]